MLRNLPAVFAVFYRRKFGRRAKGKGKGRRKRHPGYLIYQYLASLDDTAYEELFFGRRGKGKGKGFRAGKRSSGKGKGRRGNPYGKDGKRMKCYAIKPDGTPCGSEDHLAKECPHKTGSSTLVTDYRQDTFHCPALNI